VPLSLDFLNERKRQEPDWVISGWLKRRNTGLILGPPKKACKSWLLLDMLWSLSEGQPVWGVKNEAAYLFTPPRALRCVYFTQEDTEDDIHDRTLNHFKRGRKPNDRLWIVPKNLQMSLDTIGGRNLIQQELDKVRETAGDIDIVAFDPMRRMHHGDENDSRTIVEIWDVTDRIHRRYDCSTIFTHHITKPPRDTSAYDATDPFNGRGSGDIYGGGDAFMVVIPGQGTDKFRRVGVAFESKRGRPIPPAQLKVTFDTGNVEYLGSGWDNPKTATATTI
jgi:RecA-family ATPase